MFGLLDRIYSVSCGTIHTIVDMNDKLITTCYNGELYHTKTELVIEQRIGKYLFILEADYDNCSDR